MGLSDENTQTLNKSTNLQGGQEMGTRKFGVEIKHNRRALSAINQNLVGAQPQHCVVNKRVLSERTNGMCEKNIPSKIHRPITRKFAAQMASTKQVCQEENKQPKQSFTVWEDCAVTDVEVQDITEDQPVPMFLEQTVSPLNEKDETEEVEMEDIFDEDPVMDIDGCDEKNPLAVVDYVHDLYAYYRRMESSSRVSSNYMEQQADINEKMRAILIDWLIEVHHKFELREETLFLTVNLIDRFLEKQVVVRKKLQLIGLVAMLLACKYEEVSVPVVDDLVFISDKAYSRNEVLDMEKLMLNTLQFNMSVPTPYVFMRRFLKAAQSDEKLERMSFFLIELCLVEYAMLKYPPSFLAAAAIFTAQCTLYGFKQWTKTCECHTGYTEDQLQECSRMIVSYHQNAAIGKLTGVHRKYNTSKHGYAAKFEPAYFLVEIQKQ